MNKKPVLFTILILAAALLYACGGQQSSALQERIFVVNIVPGEEKLKEYLDHHRQVWPEVEAGFKKAGYKRITLSRFQNLIVMAIVVPRGASLDSMSRLAASYDKRCEDWNRLMEQYQTGVPGTASGQKWVETTTFYSFRNE